MKLHQLKPAAGAKKRKKRVGRGYGSGLGTYSGRGMKGQKSRTGSSFYPGFEGGKTPLVRLIPKKKGFKGIKNKIQEISIFVLNKNFKDGDTINKKELKKAGIIKTEKFPVKLINTGDTKKKFNIKIDRATKGAIKKIKNLGGEISLTEVLEKEKNKNEKRKTN